MINILLAIISFVVGIPLGYFMVWLMNHRKAFMVFFVMLALLLSLLILDALVDPTKSTLVQTYSTANGWTSFISVFVGMQLGSYLYRK